MIVFIDVVKSLRWPGVLVRTLLLLPNPLKATPAALSPGPAAAPADTVMVGQLPLRIRPESMPHPSEFHRQRRAGDGCQLLRRFLDMDRNAICCGSLASDPPRVTSPRGRRRPVDPVCAPCRRSGRDREGHDLSLAVGLAHTATVIGEGDHLADAPDESEGRALGE